eukprot:EG_transcript_41702
MKGDAHGGTGLARPHSPPHFHTEGPPGHPQAFPDQPRLRSWVASTSSGVAAMRSIVRPDSRSRLITWAVTSSRVCELSIRGKDCMVFPHILLHTAGGGYHVGSAVGAPTISGRVHGLPMQPCQRDQDLIALDPRLHRGIN